MKESAYWMEKKPSTMVPHKYVHGTATIFSIVAGLLANNPLEKFLGMVRRENYQAASEDRRWAYEPVSDLWSEIYPRSDSSYYGSSDEGTKYKQNRMISNSKKWY